MKSKFSVILSEPKLLRLVCKNENEMLTDLYTVSPHIKIEMRDKLGVWKDEE